jgi:hypothetical protein
MTPIHAKVGAHEKVVNVIQFLKRIHASAYVQKYSTLLKLRRDFFSPYEDSLQKSNLTINPHLILHVPEMLDFNIIKRISQYWM